jgi:hypothetical protein
MKSAKFLAIVGGMSLLLAEAATANAAVGTLRVRCEVRSNRSKISVDGKKIKSTGNVTAVVTNTDGISVAADPKLIVLKQVEFDFDSDSGDIADGATPISPNFIDRNNPHVTASIPELGLSKTATCKVKN